MDRVISMQPGCYLDAAGRDRCEMDDEVAYESEAEAGVAVAHRRAYSKQELRVYRGECGYWHMTSSTSEAG